MLKKWEKLPEFMQIDEVRPYYDILKKKKFSLFMKRVFDIVVSFIMLTLLSPTFLIIAIAIKIDSKGPVFYRQKRKGRYGRVFRIFKFRSMVANADRVGEQFTFDTDARITKVGKFIRKFRLDELPQLIDVFRGTMSFVGPRPIVVKYADRFTPEMYASFLVPAGVTSTACIKFKDESKLISAVKEDVEKAYMEEIMPAKMVYNLDDIKKFGFFREIGIMIKTVIAVLK